MKNFILFILIVFFINGSGLSQKSDKTVLKGPYLGQSNPGHEALMFAPDIVSTHLSEFCSVFSSDGNEFYFTIADPPYPVMVVVRKTGEIWGEPEILPFSGKYLDYDMNFSADGKRLFFCSRRPMEDGQPPQKHTDIWYVDREVRHWGEPQHLPGPVNSESNEFYPVFTRAGTIYFSSNRPGGRGGGDIYRARLVNGGYPAVENLGPPISSEAWEGDLFIAPDESYIIVTCYGKPDGFGSGDLYISFKNEDNVWAPLVNMGETVNSPANEHCPMVTADGKYLFFSSGRTVHPSYSKTPITLEEKREILSRPGAGIREDIYWISSDIIFKLKKTYQNGIKSKPTTR